MKLLLTADAEDADKILQQVKTESVQEEGDSSVNPQELFMLSV